MSTKPTYKDLEKRVRDLDQKITKGKTAEEALRRSEEKYRSILESIEDEYYEIDLEGKYTFVNQAVCKNQGLSREELIGLNAQDHMTPEEGKRLYKMLREVYRTGIPVNSINYEAVRKDGMVMYFEDSISLLKNSKGEPIGFSGIAHNITERKKNEEALRKSEEKYRNILDNMEEGYYEVDLAGNFIFSNESLCRMLKTPLDEVMKMNNRDYTSSETSKMIFQVFNQIYKTGLPARMIDYEVFRKDGSVIMVEVSASLSRDQSGNPIGFHGIVRDRTEQKKIEKALKKSEEKYRNILDNMEEAYYEVDLAGNFIFFNEAMRRGYGRSYDELMGMNYKAYAYPEDAGKIYAVYNQVYKAIIPSAIIDFRIIRRDGEIRTIEGSVGLLRNASGEPIGFHGVTRDRTEQKKAEAALQQSEENLRITLNSIGDAVISTDIQGKVVGMNPVAENLTGWNQAEAEGRTLNQVFRIILEKTRHSVESPVDKVLREGSIVGLGNHVILLSKEGTERPVADSAAPIRNAKGELAGVVLVFRDVTQKRKDEQALRESEEKYRNILDNMEEVYYEVDLSGNLTFFNPAMCESFGRTPDELLGLNYREYTSPEGASLLFSVYNEVFRTGIPNTLFDFPIVRIDGDIRILEGSVSLMRNASGEAIGFRGIIRDRTEQKKAESALRESEEKYRLLVENAHEGIYIIQDGVVKFSNPRTEEISGYSKLELAERPFMDLVHPKDRPDVLDQQNQKPEEGKKPILCSFRMINQKDETLWVELNTIEIQWEGRPASLNFLRDITPQKKMETQFLQAQKMEAIGTLAGGIAHDFNNLLMGIQGNASLILLDIGSDHPYYSKIKNIEKQVQAGAELTRQLLGAARGGKYEAKPTNINELIGRSLDLFGRAKKELRIHKYFQEPIWAVEVDRSQIEQVLLNLYVNAGHAMPAGGDLYVETKNILLDESYLQPYGLRPGKFVRISVTDTGIGMDEATQKRAFDPFFTTREIGRGTGLGLASAYGIVKNHNGIINIYSEKGEGTTVNIYLPATEKAAIEKPELREEVFMGTESILLVDDEEAIADIGRRLLERLGYRVILAGSGTEAVEIYRREQGRIDLIILDMIMPGISGGETFEQLKAINPSVIVLLSSGYSINGQAKTILDRGCKGFLQKPFGLVDLSKKVRQVLDEKS